MVTHIKRNKRGIAPLVIVIIGFLVIASLISIGGSMTLPISAISSVNDCGFDSMHKIKSFVWEDFSRRDISPEKLTDPDQIIPPPTGWRQELSGGSGIHWDAIYGKVDCGRGCSYMTPYGQNDALNRFGSYSIEAFWNIYRYDYDLKQENHVFDFENVKFSGTSRPDIGKIHDEWYIAGLNDEGSIIDKQVFFSWGNGGDVADKEAGTGQDFNPSSLRFCVDAGKRKVTVLTFSEGKNFKKTVDISNLRGDKWILGMQGSTGGTTRYFGVDEEHEATTKRVQKENNVDRCNREYKMTGKVSLGCDLDLQGNPKLNVLGITNEVSLFAYNSSASPQTLSLLAVTRAEIESRMIVNNINAEVYQITEREFIEPFEEEPQIEPILTTPQTKQKSLLEKILDFFRSIFSIFTRT